MTNEIPNKNNLKSNSYAQVIDKLNRKQRKPKETQYRDSFKLCRVRPVKQGKNLALGCCDKSIRSHIGLENLQFCVVSLVTLQIGTFEHLATQNTMLQNPYFFCLFSSKRLYISQLCQQYIVIAYLCNN